MKALSLLGCLLFFSCSGGGAAEPGNAAPVVYKFIATPGTLTQGGDVTFTWEARNATSLTIDPGAHAVTGTTAKLPVWQDTTFTLTARNDRGTVTAKTDVTFKVDAFTSTVDAAVKPQQETLGEHDLAALVDPEGVQSDFVLDEVRFTPRDAAELQAFLTRVHGTVMETDAIAEPPASLGITLTAEQKKAHEYRIHLEGSGGDPGTLAVDAPRLGIGGANRFSSERARNFFAFITHEAAATGLRVQPNFMEYPQNVAFSTAEAPSGGGKSFDAFNTASFPEYSSGGSKASVTLAWQYLAALKLPRRIRVAIIDGGFWLNPDGSPQLAGLLGTDFVGTPLQHDFVGRDEIADGPGVAKCGGGASCPWHGNSCAGVAVGAVNNGGGAAGTGGMVADPILFKIDNTAYEIHSAVKSAPVWGADVVSMSFAGACNWSCRQYDRNDDVFAEATAAGTVLVAAAGNDGVNVSTEYVHPCINDNVICVGALQDGSNTRYSSSIWSSAFGPQVDIWAPTNLASMADPGKMFIGTFGGTSASTPFVAGIIAMLKAIDPSLGSEQVRTLLQDSAWTDSPDGTVDHSINALKAVQLASKRTLSPDALENNDADYLASLLTVGTRGDLNISAPGDRDYFSFTLAVPSAVTVQLAFPDELGSVVTYNGGVAKKTGCGVAQLKKDAPLKNGRKIDYQLPAGTYHLPLSATAAIPYDLMLSMTPAGGESTPKDGYEPNDTYPQRTYVSDANVVAATLHAATDVDWFSFYSLGDRDTTYVSFVSKLQVLSSDMPLRISFFDSKGAFLASASEDAACAQKPSFHAPVGWVTVKVEADVPGSYVLFLGQTATAHQFIDLSKLDYLQLGSDTSQSYLVTQPVEWLQLYTNTDYRTAGFHLVGPDVHVSVFTEDGKTKLGEGVAAKQLQGTADGEDVLFPAESSDKNFILKLERVIQPGSTTASTLDIPVAISMQTGGL